MTAQTLAAAFAPAIEVARTENQQKGHGASISLRGLSKSFGPKKVLNSVDLFVSAGQFLAVVGKSGCGKSTLLRTIVGIEKPSSGAVMVGGGKLGLGRLMFQEPRLLPWARVVDNVAAGVRDRSDKKAARQKALDALREVGLADRADEWPSVLSGGQKQRVALARALVSHPQLLALDEPLGALDALTRIEMQALIERVWREQRFTAVLVTHDVAEALALADRVVLIEEGEIALDLNVDLPRPRRRGSPELARLEGAILDRLFGNEGASPRPEEPVEPAKNRGAVA